MEEKFVTVDDKKIRYLESGKSDDFIVLIHGLGASAERWEFVIPEFSKHYKVIVPDLIGFGHSDNHLLIIQLIFSQIFCIIFFTHWESKKLTLLDLP